jgi:hypothetical protein
MFLSVKIGPLRKPQLMNEQFYNLSIFPHYISPASILLLGAPICSAQTSLPVPQPVNDEA